MESRTRTRRIALLSPLAFALAFGAYAEDNQPPLPPSMPGIETSATDTSTAEATADAAPSTAAFEAATAKMQAGMDIAFTGDADVDFVREMIAHHQGAIDTAKIELENGDDAQVRKVAQQVITTQQAEITWMEDWLEKNARP